MGVPGIEPRSAPGKANALPVAFSLGPVSQEFLKRGIKRGDSGA